MDARVVRVEKFEESARFGGRSGVIPGSFWHVSRVILASFQSRFGIIPVSLRHHSKLISASVRGHFGIILGSFWGHGGIILGLFWDHSGIIPALSETVKGLDSTKPYGESFPKYNLF